MKNVRAGAAVAVAIGLGGYFLGRAGAEGVPTTDPLVYSGMLMDGGVPVDGLRRIGVTIWTDPTSTAGAKLV